MKTLNMLAASAVLVTALSASGAAAAQDVETGDQLVDVCRNLIDGGHAAGSDGEPCKDFLIGLIMPQQETLTLG